MPNAERSPEQVGRRFAEEQLDSVVEMLLDKERGALPRRPSLMDVAGPPWQVPKVASLRFHAESWEDAPTAERDEVAVRVWAHRERLEAFLGDQDRFRDQEVDRKRATIHDLVYYLALVVVPCFTHLGRYPEAVAMTRLLFGLSRSRPFRGVSGAGSRGEPIKQRHLLLTLVLWALARHYPSQPHEET
jgi:hypothetical protein